MINTHMKAEKIAPQGSFLLPCRPHLNKEKVAKDSAKGGSSTSKSNFFLSNKSKIPLTSTSVTLLIIKQSGQERFLKIVPFLLEAFRRSHYVCLLVKHPKENKNASSDPWRDWLTISELFNGARLRICNEINISKLSAVRLPRPPLPPRTLTPPGGWRAIHHRVKCQH